MSEEELRELERRAANGGTEERLRWARALERVSRADDAYLVLLGARESPEARAWLASYPARTEARGSGWVDVAPLRAKPTLLWTSPGERATPAPGLLASPLGVVMRRRSREDLVTVALDPDTGRERFVVSSRTAFFVEQVVGDVLVLDHREGRDLWTGEPLWQRGPDEPPVFASHAGVAFAPTPTGALGAYEWTDPRRAPPLERPLWTASLLHPVSGLRKPFVAPTASLVVVAAPGETEELLLLDSRSGRVLAEVPTASAHLARADDEGVVAPVRSAQPGLVACDATGKAIWTTDEGVVPLALTSRVVVAWNQAPLAGRLLLLDRSSGGVVTDLTASESPYSPIAVARDVIYVTVGDEISRAREVVARSFANEELWSFEIGPEPVTDLAPLPGRLLVRTREGTVRCLAGR